MVVQNSHPSGRVVSVRLPDDVLDRLDALSERTGRSRGVYLRMAVAAMLPLMEADHWQQQTAGYEKKTFEREFIRITNQLMDNDEN